MLKYNFKGNKYLTPPGEYMISHPPFLYLYTRKTNASRKQIQLRKTENFDPDPQWY